MKEKEKIKLHLNIGEQRFSLSQPADRQDFIRKVEAEVNGLYGKWRKAFPAKTDKEVLAMVAYQYASFYSELKEKYLEAQNMADDCLGMLEKGE